VAGIVKFASMASFDEESDSKQKSKRNEMKDLIDKEEFTLRKRLPRKFPKRNCDVYVSRHTNFKQQLERCQKILDNGNVVYIHGLGVAINRAINLSLQLKTRGMGSVETAAHTSTVELTDDFEPTTDDHEAESTTRNNSAIHIRVYRQDLQAEEKKVTTEASAVK